MIETIEKLTGFENGWILIAAAALVLCVILLIALIVNISKKRGLRKELAELKEYVTGLEAVTKLPPMKNGGLGDSDSVVFASVKERKRMMEQAQEGGENAAMPEVTPAAKAAAEQPEKPAEQPAEQPAEAGAQPEEKDVATAVHEAILASVSGSHPKAVDEKTGLSGRIPRI